MPLIIKSNIKKAVKDVDKENAISSVAEEAGTALERKGNFKRCCKKSKIEQKKNSSGKSNFR